MIERIDHFGHVTEQCRLLRRTKLDMASARCIRAWGAIDLHLEKLSVPGRKTNNGDKYEGRESFEPWFIQREPIVRLYERTSCASEPLLLLSISGVVSRVGMPWYHSSNTGRIATIKNNCNLFIEVKRLGASGTARVCESESDFSNSFDAIFSYALRRLRQFRPA